LSARSRYIIAVEGYQRNMDQFNITLGLPLGHQLNLDEKAMEEIDALGLLAVPIAEKEGFGLALTNRLDLINQIDIFEDSQRKIKIAADRLKADLNIVSSASLESERPTDYAEFDINDYRASVGLQLDLPIDRLLERNAYRSSLLAFERQIRTLALFLDNVRNAIREDLRTLEQARQNYEIQRVAQDLAGRRVDNMRILQQAGQAIIRDVLDAQSDLLSANNAVTLTLLNYHLTRLRLLRDLGIMKSDDEKFWLKDHITLYKGAAAAAQAKATGASTELIPPDKLFEK
jgi:outer membrane protein TolC